MILWRIEGDAENGSNGGTMVVFAVTGDSGTLPDPDEALTAAANQYQWYNIKSIEQICELPEAWTASRGCIWRGLMEKLG